MRAADEAIDRDFAAGRRPCNYGCMSPRFIATVDGRWPLPESTLVSSVHVDIPRITWLCGSYEGHSYSQRSDALCRHVLRAHHRKLPRATSRCTVVSFRQCVPSAYVPLPHCTLPRETSASARSSLCPNHLPYSSHLPRYQSL